MYQILLVIFLLIAISIIVLIMLQHSKGTTISSSLHNGISNTLFSSGTEFSSSTRIITVLVILFFLFSLILGNLSSNHKTDNQWNNLQQDQGKYKLLAHSNITSKHKIHK